MTGSSSYKVLSSTQKNKFSLQSLSNKLKRIGKSSDVGEKHFTICSPKMRANFYIWKREVFKTRKGIFLQTYSFPFTQP